MVVVGVNGRFHTGWGGQNRGEDWPFGISIGRATRCPIVANRINDTVVPFTKPECSPNSLNDRVRRASRGHRR